MDLVKLVSKYLDSPPRPSMLTRWLTRYHSPSSSSSQSPKDTPFIQFWVKADTTGITKLRELLCAKHYLQSWKSNDGRIYAFICVDCDAAFYVNREKFKEAWTREDPDIAEFRAHWWEEEKEAAPPNSTDSEIPEILEFQGSATEIRPQPTYAGFVIPEEEV